MSLDYEKCKRKQDLFQERFYQNRTSSLTFVLPKADSKTSKPSGNSIISEYMYIVLGTESSIPLNEILEV